MASTKEVKELADRLISTLSGSMSSDKADAIVRDVAEALYRDVLGIPGKIVVDRSKPVAMVHVGGSRGVKKHRIPMADYKFKQEAAE